MTTKDAADDSRVEQYEELTRKVSAQTLERIHEEAFAELTPNEREAAFDTLSQGQEGERPIDASSPALAAAATRVELRHPGELGRMFGTRDGDPGSGGLFNTFVAYALGSELAFAALTFPGVADGDPDDLGFIDGGL